jgi:hypothetical protein
MINFTVNISPMVSVPAKLSCEIRTLKFFLGVPFTALQYQVLREILKDFIWQSVLQLSLSTGDGLDLEVFIFVGVN